MSEATDRADAEDTLLALAGLRWDKETLERLRYGTWTMPPRACLRDSRGDEVGAVWPKPGGGWFARIAGKVVRRPGSAIEEFTSLGMAMQAIEDFALKKIDDD